MSQAASSTQLPAASPSGSPGGSKPEVVTTYDSRGFTTLVTLYPGTTPPATTAGRLQNNVAQTGAPVAPAAGSSASRLFDGIYLQLIAVVLGFVWQQAW
jgi:hypothetical protein